MHDYNYCPYCGHSLASIPSYVGEGGCGGSYGGSGYRIIMTDWRYCPYCGRAIQYHESGGQGGTE